MNIIIVFTPLQLELVKQNAALFGDFRIFVYRPTAYALVQFRNIIETMNFDRKPLIVNGVFGFLRLLYFIVRHRTRIIYGDYNSRFLWLLLWFKIVPHVSIFDEGSSIYLLLQRQALLPKYETIFTHSRLVERFCKKAVVLNLQKFDARSSTMDAADVATINRFRIWILGSPSVEGNRMSAPAYFKKIKSIAATLETPAIYFSHRRESEEKLKKIEKYFHVLRSPKAVEYIFSNAAVKKPDKIVSVGSSADVTLSRLDARLHIEQSPIDLEDIAPFFREEYATIVRCLKLDMKLNKRLIFDG